MRWPSGNSIESRRRRRYGVSMTICESSTTICRPRRRSREPHRDTTWAEGAQVLGRQIIPTTAPVTEARRPIDEALRIGDELSDDIRHALERRDVLSPRDAGHGRRDAHRAGVLRALSRARSTASRSKRGKIGARPTSLRPKARSRRRPAFRRRCSTKRGKSSTMPKTAATCISTRRMIDVTVTQRLDTAGAMPSTMMDVQMTIPWILEHALHNHPAREIVSRSDSGPLYRGTFAEFGARVAQLAHALVEFGRTARRPGRELRAGTRTGISSSTTRCRRSARCCTPRTSGSSPIRSLGRSNTPTTSSSSSRASLAPAFARRHCGARVRPAARRDGRAARRIAERALVRSVHRREAHDVRLARDRRTQRRDPVLHLGDDGRSQGRRVFAPLLDPARARRSARRRARYPAARRRSCRSFRCSTSTPGGCRSSGRWSARRW